MKSLRMVPVRVRGLTGGRWLWTNFIKMCRDSPGPPPEPGPENNIPLWCSETSRGQIQDPGAQPSPFLLKSGVNIQVSGWYIVLE